MSIKKLLTVFLSFALTAPILCACSGGGTKNDADSSHKDTTAAVDAPASEFQTYKRVILLGVDGAGNFFRNADTPNMDRIFANGATTYDMLTANPTISAECWGSMLIGSSASVHGLTNSIVDSAKYTNTALPTVFSRIRAAYPDAALASICNWNPINNGIVENDIGVFFNSDGDDAVVCQQILSYLEENDPTFLFVQFDNVDGAGHANGYGSEAHLAQITATDGYIGQVYDFLNNKDMIEDTLFIVTADHGGTPDAPGSHGGLTDAEKYVFFGAAGTGVKAGTIGDMNVRDTAAVVLQALGIQVPEFDLESFSGQVPEGLFEGLTLADRKPLATELVHETLPTPEKGSGKHLTDFISEDKISAALFFDGDTTNSIGNAATTAVGTPKFYSVGYFGQNTELGKQGHVILGEDVLDDNNFSISVFFYYPGPDADGEEFILYSTNDWANGGNGMSMTLANATLTFTASNKGVTDTLSFRLPEYISKGWVNSTVVIDKEASTLTHSFNFTHTVTERMSPQVSKRSGSFTCYPLTVGLDGAGAFAPSLNLMMDDFILYNSALTSEELQALAVYYGFAE